MQNYQFTLDSQNLKKAIPLALGLAIVLGIAVALIDFLGGVWGIVLVVAWAYVGLYFANLTLASGSKPQALNVGINGAILAAIAGILYDVISWVVIGIRYQNTVSDSIISLYFVETGIIGGLAAFAWYAYKTSAQ